MRNKMLFGCTPERHEVNEVRKQSDTSKGFQDGHKKFQPGEAHASISASRSRRTTVIDSSSLEDKDEDKRKVKDEGKTRYMPWQ